MDVIDTTTPPEALKFGSSYDWRREKWVKGASEAATFIALRIAAAFSGEDEEFGTAQLAEDARVKILANPSLAHDQAAMLMSFEEIRYRLAHAIAQCIDDGLAEARAKGISLDVPPSVFTDSAEATRSEGHKA
jgi:hypothetical protein